MSAPAVEQQYDLLGNEINVDSYVVSGTGQGEVIVAKVIRIYNSKAGGYSEYRIRVDLEIVLSSTLIQYHADPSAFYQRPKTTTTAGISNVMVITPDMKQLAMIAKLRI